MIQKIASQHRKLFPKADLEGQMAKYNEEMDELINAKTKEKRTLELADCYICCAGMYRFDRTIAETYVAIVEVTAESLGIDWSDVLDVASKKWAVNMKRKWEYKDGKYHHIGIDGLE